MLSENAAFSVSRTSFSQPVERVPYESPPGKEEDRPKEREVKMLSEKGAYLVSASQTQK